MAHFASVVLRKMFRKILSSILHSAGVGMAACRGKTLIAAICGRILECLWGDACVSSDRIIADRAGEFCGVFDSIPRLRLETRMHLFRIIQRLKPLDEYGEFSAVSADCRLAD